MGARSLWLFAVREWLQRIQQADQVVLGDRALRTRSGGEEEAAVLCDGLRSRSDQGPWHTQLCHHPQRQRLPAVRNTHFRLISVPVLFVPGVLLCVVWCSAPVVLGPCSAVQLHCVWPRVRC